MTNHDVRQRWKCRSTPDCKALGQGYLVVWNTNVPSLNSFWTIMLTQNIFGCWTCNFKMLHIFMEIDAGFNGNKCWTDKNLFRISVCQCGFCRLLQWHWGDLRCLTKLGSLSWRVGGDWLVLKPWLKAQMVEGHQRRKKKKKKKKCNPFEWGKDHKRGLPESQRSPSGRVTRVNEGGRLLQQTGILHLHDSYGIKSSPELY